MKRFAKIFLSVLGVLVALLVVLWLVFKPKPQWDPHTGHSVEERTIVEEKFTKVENIKWASPKGFNLTMDIYTPNTGQEKYPVIVMFHGGGWLINDKGIMEQASTYLASSGKYVVCNVNYRLLVDLDNTVLMNEIVEDAFGSILWVKAHIAKYKGDPRKVILTGDSAGGHLAAMAVMQGTALSSQGFTDGPLGFLPTWLPEGKSAEDIARENGLSVQAAIFSYGAFDLYEACGGNSGEDSGFESSRNIFWVLASGRPRGIFGEAINAQEHPEYYQMISPVYQYPDSSERKLPPLLFTAGESDPVVTPASVKAFVQKLKEAGHDPVEYWEYAGQSHAFLDSGGSFEAKAVPALEVMLAFLDRVFD